MQALALTVMAALLFCQANPTAEEQDSQNSRQEAEKPSGPRIGEVTGNNVYVRSGPSTNYYEVTRLNEGDRVLIYESRYGWMSIAPPEGTFSLISKDFVDPDTNNKGVVNDRVWVRTGSGLAAGKSYAKQLTLNPGQSVDILGEMEEFYQIKPPEGARVWISDQFVRILGPAEVAQATPTGQEAQRARTDPSQPQDVALPPAPSNQGIARAEIQETIDSIEADLEAEFAKNPFDRDLVPFIERFKPLADQQEDYAAQQYAQYRIGQLRKVMERNAMLDQLRSLSSQVQAEREKYRKLRSNIRPPALTLKPEFAVHGKLLKSYAYSSPSGPQRYRLVDPEDRRAIPRTVAYIEIPPDSELEPQSFLGRYVGVRAKGQRLLEGAVDPVVVYTAAELVIIEPPKEVAAPQD